MKLRISCLVKISRDVTTCFEVNENMLRVSGGLLL